MKKKYLFSIAFICVSIISVFSLGLNIYFLATKPEKASGIFNMCQNSVVEIKAKTEDFGTSHI